MNQIAVSANDLPGIVAQLPLATRRNGSVTFTVRDGAGVLLVGDDTLGAVQAAMAAPALTAANRQLLLDYASAKQNTVLAGLWSFDVGTAAAPLQLTTRLDAAGQSAMTQLAMWGLVNAAAPGASQSYSNVDFSAATITPAQATLLKKLSDDVISASYAVLNSLSTGIAASPPTVTTTTQIDAASWPNPSS